MSNVHELNFLKEKINELKEEGVYRELPVLETPNQAEVIITTDLASYNCRASRALKYSRKS